MNIRPLRVRFGSRGHLSEKQKIPLLYWRADLGAHTKPMRARKPERCYIAGRYKVTNEINILTICDYIFFLGGGADTGTDFQQEQEKEQEEMLLLYLRDALARGRTEHDQVES